MRRKLCSIGLMFALLVGLQVFPVNESYAAKKSAIAALPNFSVTLNGNKVDNQYREYPLIVYKNMTYFPMTWYDSRLLGLETTWSKKAGLNITEGNVTSSYEPYKTAKKNPKRFTVAIPSFKIAVNGKPIDNTKQEYPLLSYKNVTYFPLTWDYAYKEFGWEYVWDRGKGLTINSDNPKVKTINLPKTTVQNNVAVYDGYYYYVETSGTTNNIYRVATDNISAKELVYSYEIDTMYGFQYLVNFEWIDNELWFWYHVGGASMGKDVYVKVQKNGKATIEHQGYLDFVNFPKGTLIIYQFVPPGGNNLLFVPAGSAEENGIRIGDPNLIYGWHIVNDNQSSRGFRGDHSTTILGNDVFVMASPNRDESGDLNKIYKINITTNEVTKLINSEVYSFKIINDKLYYVKVIDQCLYSANLDGTNEQRLSDYKVADNNWYGAVDGNVYYTSVKSEDNLNLYKAEMTKEDVLVLKEAVEDVQFTNNKIICRLKAGEEYGVKVFNKTGELELAIADQVSSIFVNKDTILLVSTEKQLVNIVELMK